MANYYYVKIENENVTQEAAAEIFAYLSDRCHIRYFDFAEGLIKYNTRGLSDIDAILKKYNIPDSSFEAEDEFTRFWNSIPPEELKAMEEEYAKEKEAEENLPPTVRQAPTFDF